MTEVTRNTPRVLLADDELVFARATSDLLSRHGFDSQTVADAAGVLEKLEAQDFDVVIADIKMPGNNELELFEALSASPGHPALILITGYPSVDTASRAVDLGAFAYKIKPFDLDEFITTVGEAVRYSQLRRQVSRHYQNTRSLLNRIETLQDGLERPRARSLDESCREYLRTLMTSIAESSIEGMSLLDLVDDPDCCRPLRDIAGHPEAEVLRNALQESIEVLERTRHSFKSRELATLRKRLTQLMEITGD